MLPRYRVQIRKHIEPTGEEGSGTYVFRDLELPFAPVPGMVIEDLGHARFRLEEVVWHEGQHRFVVRTPPHVEASPGRTTEKILADLEANGWRLNRRSGERNAA